MCGNTCGEVRGRLARSSKLSFHSVGSRDQIQVISLGGKSSTPDPSHRPLSTRLSRFFQTKPAAAFPIAGGSDWPLTNH